MVLSTGGGDRTSELSDADEDRKVAEPNESEAVDEASWAAATIGKYVNRVQLATTYFWKPMAKMLSAVSLRLVKLNWHLH